jgi:hypothetical protein
MSSASTVDLRSWYTASKLIKDNNLLSILWSMATYNYIFLVDAKYTFHFIKGTLINESPMTAYLT